MYVPGVAVRGIVKTRPEKVPLGAEVVVVEVSEPFQTTVMVLDPAKPSPDKVVVSPACPEVELKEIVGVMVKTTLVAVCPAPS